MFFSVNYKETKQHIFESELEGLLGTIGSKGIMYIKVENLNLIYVLHS